MIELIKIRAEAFVEWSAENRRPAAGQTFLRVQLANG
jgi:hypothetical protein